MGKSITACLSGVLLFCLSAFTIEAVEIGGMEVDRSRVGSPEIRQTADALAHYISGMIFDNYGMAERAAGEYRKALRHRPDSAEIYLKLGAALLFQGRTDEACEVLEKATSLDPDNIKPYLMKALVLTSRGDFTQAEAQYKEALEREPENLKVLTFLSDLYVIQKKLDKAADIYERILLIKQNDPFLYYNLGVIYSKLDELERAQENLEKAVEKDRGYIEAQLVLGYVYEIDGKIKQALEQYSKITEIAPLNREAHVRLGQLYYRTGDIKSALEQNRLLMRIDPRSSEPYLRNFTIYIAEEEYDEADRVLREALRKGISDSVIYASMGYLASQKGDHLKAVQHYITALREDPGNMIYRFYLAAAYDRAGNRRKAIEMLEKIVQSGARIPEAYNYLGYIYVEEDRDLDRAIRLIGKALKFDPDNGAYVDSLGWAYYKKGMMDKAVVLLRKAAELLPADPSVREHLGDVYFRTGRIKKAVEQWEKALEAVDDGRALEKKINRARQKLKGRR
ncbi:MAG: tetratricopeptide repeat protein [Candidatus Omnitrophica bacterium]|nr:tetratricopeptide repeat protein [Candidatus Omnitrophota bacterium]